MKEFQEFLTDIIEHKDLRIEYLTNAGPRIISLHFQDINLFAQIPDVKVNTPNGIYRFLGGHRLWTAPENLATTYYPDDTPPEINVSNKNEVLLKGKRNKISGIEKSMSIRLDPDHPSVRIDHTISNFGEESITLAPWSLTQLVMNGFAILPQETKPVDDAGYLPNRNLILWPYTRWQDDRIHFRDDFYLIKAKPKNQALKIGYMNTHGWMAYVLQNIIFCKTFFPKPDELHPDLNSNSEAYVKDQFIELETLGPLVSLEPGKKTIHTEIWDLFVLEEPMVSIEQVKDVESFLLNSISDRDLLRTT